MSKIILIDGMSIVFRAFHALSASNFKSPTGEPTGALYGFANIVAGIIDREKPDYIAVAFDRAEPTFRHIQFEQYKANRAEFPDELVPQLPKIKKFLDLIGIPQFELAGYEADDIIGTIATQMGQDNYHVYCLTSDKDYFQLVNDYVSILRPTSKPGSDFELVSYDGVLTKFGVAPHQVIEVMALTGDAVDNIPGVKGIGEKTAIPLIQEFGTLESLYDNIDKVTREVIKNKLINERDNAFTSRELVTINLNVPLEYSLDSLSRKQIQYNDLDTLLKEAGFTKIRQYWNNKSVLDINNTTKDIAPPIPSQEVIHFEILTENKNISAKINSYKSQKEIFFEFIFDNPDRQKANLIGVAIASGIGDIAICKMNIFPTSSDTLFSNDLFSGNSNNNAPADEVGSMNIINQLKDIFANPSIIKISNEIKNQAFSLANLQIIIENPIFDFSLASYLLNPDDKHTLDSIYVANTLNDLYPHNQQIDKKSISTLPVFTNEDIITQRIAKRVFAYSKLYPIISQKIKDEKIEDLANNIEFPLVKVLTDIEFEGVKLDKKSLQDFSLDLGVNIEKLKENIFEEAGEEFNLDSPKQLGFILFEKLGLPTIKKTKTGYSTDASVLTELSGLNPVIDNILDYRQLTKLKSTYVDALPKLINPNTNRIHTTYNQTIAATGRLSSTDPNLQNIPIRSERGKEIRKAFIPSSSEKLILSADYSQIELRIMAYYSNDTSLIDAFKNDLDIHSTTAAKLFGCEISEVDSEQRRVAKAVNFGIMYGLGAFGLSQGLKITRKRAQAIIDNYFEKYPGIKKYIDDTILSTHKNGFAETLMKRRRYFPEINNRNQNIKTAAERAAINMPIQGTASDMIKLAMIQIFKSFQEQGIQSKMILQVHDEIVIDLIPSEEEKIKAILQKDMSEALPLGEIPVKIEIGIGKNWLEAH
ncbi:MAG: DNA polymerase I [Ignavibacteria bacterium GWF2_33_9]|nr:MAG: DNA polymerase I [Ignavibacteria bacterium GWF2_33_9]